MMEMETRRRGDAESQALAAMGYRVEEDGPGRFAFTLETPFEGASVRAEMSGNGRDWAGDVRIVNCRGTGWIATYGFRDVGRYVAKGLLRHIAIEVRRAYCHRSQKIRKRSIARAIARRGTVPTAEEASRDG